MLLAHFVFQASTYRVCLTMELPGQKTIYGHNPFHFASLAYKIQLK